MPFPFVRFRLALALAAAMLAGCTSGARSVLETLAYAARPDARVESAPLNANFEYLRTIAEGRVAMLALGYVEADATAVFYSGSAETLHIRHGRIVRFTSAKKRIDALYNPETSPSALITMRPGETVIYQRLIDQRPEYAFSQSQSVKLTRLKAPPLVANLVKLDRRSLVWFEERVRLDKGELRSIFAVDEKSVPTVVYSEQCIVKDFCLTLQRWSASGAF